MKRSISRQDVSLPHYHLQRRKHPKQQTPVTEETAFALGRMQDQDTKETWFPLLVKEWPKTLWNEQHLHDLRPPAVKALSRAGSSAGPRALHRNPWDTAASRPTCSRGEGTMRKPIPRPSLPPPRRPSFEAPLRPRDRLWPRVSNQGGSRRTVRGRQPAPARAPHTGGGGARLARRWEPLGTCTPR